MEDWNDTRLDASDLYEVKFKFVHPRLAIADVYRVMFGEALTTVYCCVIYVRFMPSICCTQICSTPKTLPYPSKKRRYRRSVLGVTTVEMTLPTCNVPYETQD